MKQALQYFRELATKQGAIPHAPHKRGIYIRNAPKHQFNILSDNETLREIKRTELRNNLRVLIKGCLKYRIQRPTFHRWQFDTADRPFAVIWHLEKDTAEWIEILEK